MQLLKIVCINLKNLDLNHSSMQTEYINEKSKIKLRFVFLKFYIKFTSLNVVVGL